MRFNDKVLLFGGSGSLGSSIIKSKIFKNIKYPNSKELDLTKEKKIKLYFKKNFSNIIIHSAGLSSMSECEINPLAAVKKNILITSNIVNLINKYQKKNKKIKLVFISSDGVYAGTKGNYSEKSDLKPYNFYCWTKFISENIVKFLDDYIIIRTRFFDEKKKSFKSSATDIFTSKVHVNELPFFIEILLKKNFKGIINIGGKKISDYNFNKRYIKNLKKIKYNNIQKNLNFKIAKNASLNIDKYKNLIK
jgi:dTDP-4-dehydrorhamnose reductase